MFKEHRHYFLAKYFVTKWKVLLQQSHWTFFSFFNIGRRFLSLEVQQPRNDETKPGNEGYDQDTG